MTDNEQNQAAPSNQSFSERLANLGKQGQSWRSIGEIASFRRPAPLFDRPMEISIAMLRGLRMVDETIVVHGAPPENSDKKEVE